MPDRPTDHPMLQRTPDPSGIDAPFAIDHVHRLRFTSDVFDPANRVLGDVIRVCGEPERKVACFLDSGVANAWPDLPRKVADYAEAHPQTLQLACEPLLVPGGEIAKNDRSILEKAIAAIDDHGICRHSFVLVVGGGAVLDAVGFAAATVHRGVRLIRIPTTTLAQCDGGLGVKNGVNAMGKKNLLGSFAVPWAVINDWQFLSTLSERDFRGGFSEVVKVALLKDPSLFEVTAAEASRVASRDPAVCEQLIRRSAELHLDHIVNGGDPFELTTSRPLDFGHWAAHKLEQITAFRVRHGEAVAIGLALDVVYSSLCGWLDWPVAERILTCMEDLGFDLFDQSLQDPQLIEGLEEFREHLGGKLTITLLQGIGAPKDIHEMDRTLVQESIKRLASRRTTRTDALPRRA